MSGEEVEFYSTELAFLYLKYGINPSVVAGQLVLAQIR
ncbi:hypothetical protein PPEP_a0910 [Pseudoalteromonas peptidolytica F12-50-A1]|uniref:Uncharacterized protein n=1 Tax=Pseudoalteromonas peptidolytica F12-50-A1 TaxID=1315280 RepID=A0A8I0MV48_9GAMM|nr:hypothetical protein [Pseudoalteromonas peptidolytica F12-50-A1]